MKTFFSTLLVVFFATSMMAQTGLTCEDPIPVDKNFSGHVDVDPDEGYKELWYSAWTWDLPMHVYFSPDSTNKLNYGPDVQIDFTCSYGDYSHDHKLDSVINILRVMGLTLPVEFVCDKVERNGKWEWDLAIDEKYRDQLTTYGLTHNIQAFVKVTYYEGGSISLTPDTAFQSCLEHGHYVQLGETIQVAANDTEKMFVLPYSEWQKDSIRFVWTGDKPACVWVAEDECQFTPTDASVYVKAKYEIDKNSPKKLYPSDMESAIKNWIGAGIFYAKVTSEGEGQLIVEKIPLGEIQGDAVLLKHGETVSLVANDSRVFCFPKTWNATEFLANTQYLMGMHVSNTPDFVVGDENVISVYPFSSDDNSRSLQLSAKDIATLASSASDDYLYVRFACNSATKLAVSSWDASSCANQSILIRTGERFLVPANSSATLYRMRYADWVGYDFNIKWTGNNTLPCYFATVCDFMLSSADPNMLFTPAVPGRNNVDVKSADISGWAERLEDGIVYVRFSPSAQGRVTFTSAKPAETDPEGPVLDPVYTTESATICFGETYPWNGKEYNATGEYTYTTVAANGADSIVTLNLTVLPEVPVTEEVAAICFGETYTWQGEEYTESGEYSVTYQDVNGCDSVVSLALTVYPQTEATTENVEVAYGETYTWHGITYTESGEYTITLQDENGCDYQATLVLTVLPEERPENPCVAASTLLEPVATLTLNLGDAFDIYRIDYQAWLASGVNLVWTGKGALHTFVAKHCEFAVAVYHKEVVNYTEVPAEGNVILSKAILAPLAQYVDADGYLYVRFLTEQEGQLTTAIAE